MKRLIVSNLSPSTTEETLYRFFDRFGPVSSCVLIIDPQTHEPTGAAVVELEEDNNAAHALDELQGQIVDDSQVQVNEAPADLSRERLNERGWTAGVPRRAGE